MTKKRLLSLLLAGLLLSASACSSGGAPDNPDSPAADAPAPSGDAQEGAQEPAETADLFEAYRGIDLGGRTMNISVSNNVTENGDGMPTS